MKLKKTLKALSVLLAALTLVSIVPGVRMVVSASALSKETEGNIASGKDKEITWVIDADGKLTVDGEGDVSGWPWSEYRESITSAEVNVTGMTDASHMFNCCFNLESIDLSGFDTSNVTSMWGMFNCCFNLESIDLSSFNTSNVTSMQHMFNRCDNLKSIDLSGFDTSNVTVMYRMFYGCSNLKSIDLSSFDTSNVTSVEEMFYGCSNLKSIDLSSFDTSNVTSVENMFYGCSSLNSLDLRSFDLSRIVIETLPGALSGVVNMFTDCENLSTIYTPRNVRRTVALPYSGWHLPNGTVITELPRSRSDSILIKRTGSSNVKTVERITAEKKKKTWQYGEELKTDDLIVKIYYSDGSSEQTEDYTTDAAQINMNTLGKKTLTVTSGEFTAAIEIIVTARVLDDSCRVALSCDVCEYSGTACEPAVTVSLGGATLAQGKDYSVSYQNNVNPGTAGVTVTGMGNYTGTRTASFAITKKEDSDEKKYPEKGAKCTYKGVIYRVLTSDQTGGTAEAVSAANKSITNVSISNTVKIDGYSFKVVSIKSNAFKGCTKLKTVKLGNNVASIGKKAFYGCTALTSVNIPAGVKTLEDSTFGGCKKLKTVNGFSGITTIGSKVFYNCEKLVTAGSKSSAITLSKVRTIGNSAFYGCKSVKKVNLTSTALTKIGDSAFQGCTSMTGFISKSAKLKMIGKKAFYGDKKLGSISLKAAKLKKSTVGDNAFKGIKSTCKFKVQKKQMDTYRAIFQEKGASKKCKFSKW